MGELVDPQVSEACAPKGACRFKSDYPHHLDNQAITIKHQFGRVAEWLRSGFKYRGPCAQQEFESPRAHD